MQLKLLHVKNQAEAAYTAVHHIEKSEVFKKSSRVAVYLANENEFSLSPLIARIWQEGKTCYLPIMMSSTKSLSFAAYFPNSPLMVNQFKILEPASRGQALIPADQLDMILMPLLAFDLSGNRLGKGGGYYDRTLAAAKMVTKHPYLVGVGFASQQVANVPVNDWDIPLDAILTETGIKELINKDPYPSGAYW